MEAHRPRILLADQQTLLAELCKNLLQSEFDVVGAVGNGRAVIRAVAELKPDLVLLELFLPLLNGIDAGQQVKKNWPAIKILYLTGNGQPEIVAEAFRRGASGYLLKTCTVSELIVAIRSVLRGSTYVSRTLPKEEIEWLRRGTEIIRREERPTKRQREVLQLLAQGKVMRDVGDILNMNRGTVAFHKYRMMRELGIKSTAELVRYAVRKNIIPS